MHVMQSPPGARTVIDGREVDYFCGCGYYGLHGHPELIEAACTAARKYGIGSATSRWGLGNNPVLLEVEKNAAEFFATESALYYVSGYLGNSILLQGLRDDYDVVFVDAQSHYSVLDAASVANKPVVAFAHRDAEDLKRQVARRLKPSQRPLVICDGVFPISGEVSPVDEYVEVLEPYPDRTICVDDAHATGVIGERGHGSLEYLGLSGSRLHSSGTLSKALGGHGGIIAGDNDLVERLKRKSKIPSASSSPPTPAAAATAKALVMLRENPEFRKRLWDNATYAKGKLRDLGFDLNRTTVPIICLSSKSVDLETLPDKLLDRGIAVSRFYPGAGTYSSVPEGGAIRIAIFSTHSREQIDRLANEIGALV
ncbi:MAG: pyridoxal phosphate-dependent aminotransferase family protein [Planctomycetes bacterium]|nr:pyridoxal phosphate-dependent aminotransferase family protein [Planctomycetota bacterium]